MIRFEHVTSAPFRDISFQVPEGKISVVTTGSDSASVAFTRLAVGIVRPVGGEVSLLGRDLGKLGDEEVTALCRLVGVVWSSGGLVSNLGAWENLILPLWYHRRRLPPETENRPIELLAELGFEAGRAEELLGSSVSALDHYERRVIGLVRAFLTEPELMVCESPCTGLDHARRDRFNGLIKKYHAGGSGRTVLFVNSDFQSLGAVRAGAVIDVAGEESRP